MLLKMPHVRPKNETYFNPLPKWRIVLKENIKLIANCVGYEKQYLKNYCPLSKTETQRQN